MGTLIRPELSGKNPYWLERHRYYELKHFCLQYPVWKKAYAALDGLSGRPNDLALFKATEHGNPTERCAIAKAYYSERIEMVDRTAIIADPALSDYILKGVTQGLSYEALKTKLGIPCCRDTYYDRHRRFFWLLNRERQ